MVEENLFSQMYDVDNKMSIETQLSQMHVFSQLF